MQRYMIVFSSVYKATHAQEKLKEKGYATSIAKSPAGLLKTCAYALFSNVGNINDLLSVLDRAGIQNSGVYGMVNGEYKKI